ERDRSERLLASREQREASDPLACGPQLDFDTGLGHALVRLGQAQAALAAREQRRRDLAEVGANGGERVRKAPFDRLGELGAQLLELDEASLQILPLCCELVEPPFLVLVLLLRQRVHLAERLAPPLEPGKLLREGFRVV